MRREGLPFAAKSLSYTHDWLADEERLEGEELFRALVEQAADAFFLHDADARIIDVNRRACESLGYTREELLQMSVKDFDPAFDFGGLDAWERMVPGKYETFERVHVRKDGSTFPVEVRLGVVEVAGRRLFLALVRDMTEHKRVQETLERRAMLLRSIAEVAHLRFGHKLGQLARSLRLWQGYGESSTRCSEVSRASHRDAPIYAPAL